MIDVIGKIASVKLDTTKSLEKTADKAKKDKNASFDSLLSSARNKTDRTEEKSEVKNEQEDPKVLNDVPKNLDKNSEIEESDKGNTEEVKELLTDLIELMNMMLSGKENNELTPEELQSKIQVLIEKLDVISPEILKENSVDLSLITKMVSELEEILQSSDEEVFTKFDFEMIKKVVDKANTILTETDTESVEVIRVPQEKVQETGEVFKGDSSDAKESTDEKAPKAEIDVLNNILGEGKKTSFNGSYFKNVNSLENMPKQESVRANHMAYDVVKNIKYMTNSDLKEMTLRIIPKELGEITIRLTVDSGVMRANIAAVNKDTAELLQSNGAVIQEKLEETGLKLEKVHVEIYQVTTFFSDSDKEQSFANRFKQNLQNVSDSTETEEEEEEVIQDYVINAMA